MAFKLFSLCLALVATLQGGGYARVAKHGLFCVRFRGLALPRVR